MQIGIGQLQLKYRIYKTISLSLLAFHVFSLIFAQIRRDKGMFIRAE